MCEFLTIVILFLYEVNLCVSACYDDDDDDDDEKKKNAGIDANTKCNSTYALTNEVLSKRVQGYTQEHANKCCR